MPLGQLVDFETASPGVRAVNSDIMARGALDPLTKERLYIAVCTTDNREYCSTSHTAPVNGYRVPVDERPRAVAHGKAG